MRGAMFPAVREICDALHEFEAAAAAAGLLMAAHPVVQLAANKRALHLHRLFSGERLHARVAERRGRTLAAATAARRLLARRR